MCVPWGLKPSYARVICNKHILYRSICSPLALQELLLCILQASFEHLMLISNGIRTPLFIPNLPSCNTFSSILKNSLILLIKFTF